MASVSPSGAASAGHPPGLGAMPQQAVLAPVLVLPVSSSAGDTSALARALDAHKGGRVRVVALEQHVPSIALAQVAEHGALKEAVEVPYGCSHSLNADALKKVRVPANEADLVVLLIGGEAKPSEVQSHLSMLGVSASLSPSAGGGGTAPSNEPHLHLTNTDIILFDGVTLEALGEKLKQLKGGVAALHSYEGVFNERGFAMAPGGELRQGGTASMRSPFGEGVSFVRLFGTGILHPTVLGDVGIPCLPAGSAPRFSALYPNPEEELKARGVLRPVVWEVDRWFLTLGALCENLTPEQAQKLKSRTVSGQSALSRLSTDWAAVLGGYVEYRLAVLRALDSSSHTAVGQSKITQAKAPEWGLICVSQLADVQLRFGRFLARAPELAAQVEAQKLGTRFVEYARRLSGKPPRVSAQALESLISAAEAEGVSVSERAEAKARLSASL